MQSHIVSQTSNDICTTREFVASKGPRSGRRDLRYQAAVLTLLCVFALATQASAAAAEAVLLGAGDIARCGKYLKDAEATAKLLDDVVAQHANEAGGESVPVVVFTLGDNAYKRGTAKEFRECYGPTWGRHKGRTRPAVGNHEYKTRGAEPYFDYFGAAAGEPGKGWYSYELGEWHIVVLNSACKKVGGCGKDSPQLRWLEDDLRASGAPCTVAYFHEPLFSSGKHGGEKKMRPIYETLYAHGAEIALSGHEHNYERFAPQAPDGAADPERGIRQFIVGTGGREHRRLRRAKPNSEVRDNTSFGVLKLTLRSGFYEWEFIPVEGASFRDAGSGKCH